MYNESYIMATGQNMTWDKIYIIIGEQHFC